MRFIILLTTLLLGYSYTWAQSDWAEYTQKQGIVFSVKDVVCDLGGGAPVEYKAIRIQNPTGHKARISYHIATYYVNHTETGENSPEYAAEFVLEPGQNVVGGCGNTFPARLEILVRNPNLMNAPAFSHFLLNDITIDWIE